MTILVTGATGFACINIVRALAEAGETVIAVDLVPASAACRRFLRDLEDRVQFVVGDVLDTDLMLRLAEANGVQRFVHGAAITPSDRVERSVPQRVVNVNLMGTVSVLEVARKVSAERFVFMSSSGLYAAVNDKAIKVKEDSLLHAGSLYTICKHATELLVKRYKDLFGLSMVTGRMTAIYGPMERATASRRRPSVIYRLVRACLTRQPVRVRGCEFVRDYTHAKDASAIWKHLTLAGDLRYDVYNVSSGVTYSLAEVLETFHELDANFCYSYASPGQNADVEITAAGERSALDIARVRSEFGFSPKYDLRRGLKSYLAWARDYSALFSSDPDEEDMQ